MRARIAALLAWLCVAAPALAENRVALVIGNDAYMHIASLEKAKSDAKAYAEALREKGFSVREGYDLNFVQLNAAVASFAASIAPGDTAVFVYSGHGWSDGTQNYLVSIDAPASASEDELAGVTTPIRNGVNGVLDRISARARPCASLSSTPAATIRSHRRRDRRATHLDAASRQWRSRHRERLWCSRQARARVRSIA